MGDAQVGVVEVGGVDAGELAVPGETGFVGAALVERFHVGVESGDDLDHAEALGRAVSRQLLEIFRPAQAFAEAHPPGVAQPEKGCAVRVFEAAATAGNAQRPVLEQGVIAFIGRDFERAGLVMQAAVAAVRADGAVAVGAGLRGAVAHAPGLVAAPECGHDLFAAVGAG